MYTYKDITSREVNREVKGVEEAKCEISQLEEMKICLLTFSSVEKGNSLAFDKLLDKPSHPRLSFSCSLTLKHTIAQYFHENLLGL